MSVISQHSGKLRQDDQKFKQSLANLARTQLKKKIKGLNFNPQYQKGERETERSPAPGKYNCLCNYKVINIFGKESSLSKFIELKYNLTLLFLNILM